MSALAALRTALQHTPPSDGPVIGEPLRAAVCAIIAGPERAPSICLIRRARWQSDPWSEHIALPGGRQSGDEAPPATARRELREEVELEAHDWRHLLTLRPSAGISAEEHVVFLARDLHHADRGGFALRHEEAEMEVLWVPMPRLLEAVLAGDVTEAPLVAAVLAYDVLARRGRL